MEQIFLKHNEQLALEACMRWIISVLDVYEIAHRHSQMGLVEEIKKYIITARG